MSAIIIKHPLGIDNIDAGIIRREHCWETNIVQTVGMPDEDYDRKNRCSGEANDIQQLQQFQSIKGDCRVV